MPLDFFFDALEKRDHATMVLFFGGPGKPVMLAPLCLIAPTVTGRTAADGW